MRKWIIKCLVGLFKTFNQEGCQKMIRYKVKNCIDKDKDVILEIEEEFTNTLLNGLNISVTDFESDSLIINTTLSYVQVLDLYKMLTEKICSTQIQTLDVMKSKPNKCINQEAQYGIYKINI